MKTKTLSLVVLIAVFCSTAFAQANGNFVLPPDQIIVTGSAEVEAAPDVATVRIGVLQQSTSAKDAQEGANRTGLAILKALGTLGIPAQQIQTSRLTIMPVYNSGAEQPNYNEAPRIVGYTASNVNFRDSRKSCADWAGSGRGPGQWRQSAGGREVRAEE
jgi:uncharacterized protein YggE